MNAFVDAATDNDHNQTVYRTQMRYRIEIESLKMGHKLYSVISSFGQIRPFVYLDRVPVVLVISWVLLWTVLKVDLLTDFLIDGLIGFQHFFFFFSVISQQPAHLSMLS